MLFQLKTSLEMKQRNLQNIICLLIFTVFMIRSFLLDYFPPLMRSYCSMSDRAAQHKQLKYPLQQAKFTRSITPVTLQMRWGLELICVWGNALSPLASDRIKHACTSPHNEHRSHDQAHCALSQWWPVLLSDTVHSSWPSKGTLEEEQSHETLHLLPPHYSRSFPLLLLISSALVLL